MLRRAHKSEEEPWNLSFCGFCIENGDFAVHVADNKDNITIFFMGAFKGLCICLASHYSVMHFNLDTCWNFLIILIEVLLIKDTVST